MNSGGPFVVSSSGFVFLESKRLFSAVFRRPLLREFKRFCFRGIPAVAFGGPGGPFLVNSSGLFLGKGSGCLLVSIGFVLGESKRVPFGGIRRPAL